jgi:hypothetical protein
MRMCHPLAPARVLPLPCPPTLKGDSRCRPKVFSSRPFFLVRSMSRAHLTPLPLVLVPPPKRHRSQWNRSRRRCDLCLIGERRLRAVSRPNGFAPHLPGTPPVLHVPTPTAAHHRSPMPPRHAVEPPLQAASPSPHWTGDPHSASPCQAGPLCRTDPCAAFAAPPGPPVSPGRL